MKTYIPILFAVICCSCATDRSIVVLDEKGNAVVGALVLYREFNMGFFNPVDAGFSKTNGAFYFSAVNQVLVEAITTNQTWGRLWLSDRTTGGLGVRS